MGRAEEDVAVKAVRVVIYPIAVAESGAQRRTPSGARDALEADVTSSSALGDRGCVLCELVALLCDKVLHCVFFVFPSRQKKEPTSEGDP